MEPVRVKVKSAKTQSSLYKVGFIRIEGIREAMPDSENSEQSGKDKNKKKRLIF